ncbi:MAG: hypothetical protein L6R41_004202 [Letrouitia leprolyta]|nr:MAG: hypothetical protein L6R41_004202 [Letrouitia leprolyta]
MLRRGSLEPEETYEDEVWRWSRESDIREQAVAAARTKLAKAERYLEKGLQNRQARQEAEAARREEVDADPRPTKKRRLDEAGNTDKGNANEN